MKNKTNRFVSFVLAFIMICSLSLEAAADFHRNMEWFYCYGGSITIPGSFSYEPCENNAYQYDFYNEQLDMLISLTEADYSNSSRRNIINEAYAYIVKNNPRAIYNVKEKDSFILSGYRDKNIYYVQYTLVNDVLYSILFLYPAENRAFCDPIVEKVTDSFTPGRIIWNIDPYGAPSRADLDAIKADIKYPNYDFMYLDRYIVTYVTHKAVYCFKDPDEDIWRKGNYFTVTYGTKVTILAESQGYACVILNDTLQAGWINCKYLKHS